MQFLIDSNWKTSIIFSLNNTICLLILGRRGAVGQKWTCTYRGCRGEGVWAYVFYGSPPSLLVFSISDLMYFKQVMLFIAELRGKYVIFVCWKANLPKKKPLSTIFELSFKTEIYNNKKKLRLCFISLIQILVKGEEGKRT